MNRKTVVAMFAIAAGAALMYAAHTIDLIGIIQRLHGR